MYEYKIKNVRVIDGDTVECDIDLGFYLTARHRVRLLGINTPEMNSKDITERALAAKAKEFVIQWFNKYPEAYITTYKSDAFGRWLGSIYVFTNEGDDTDDSVLSLNAELLAENLAVIY